MVAFFILIACVISAENLYLNGSFENPGSGSWPQYWKPSSNGFTSNGVAEYITTGGAADGTDFVRLRVTSTAGSKSLPYWYGDSNYQIQPNCRYRLTFSYKRSADGIDRMVMILECGSAGWGNTALEWCGSDYFDWSLYDGSQSVGVWHERSKEFSTSPNGMWNKGWGFMFFAEEPLLGGTMHVGDTLDYDHFQMELLEIYKTATLTIPVITGNAVTYDYTNTDVRIKFHSNSQGDDHTVEKKEGNAPGLTDPSLNKYWVIGNLSGTFSSTPTFFYTDAELAATGMSEFNLQLARKPDGGEWTSVYSVVDTGANSITTSSPVSSFSTWAVVEKSTSASIWLLYK